MIEKYLPEFKVVEVNNLTGLRNGHMISQVPVVKGTRDIAKKGDLNKQYIENGIIVGLGTEEDNLVIKNYDKAESKDVLFLHYTEELNTMLDELKRFAVPVECHEKVSEGVKSYVEDDTYIRCIALYVGDTFTTNNYAGTPSGAKYAQVVDGVLTLQAVATDAEFTAVPSTLPDGSDAFEFTYVGKLA